MLSAFTFGPPHLCASRRGHLRPLATPTYTRASDFLLAASLIQCKSTGRKAGESTSCNQHPNQVRCQGQNCQQGMTAGGWFPILGSWSGRVLYIDCHAGRGRHDAGQEGSPILALRVLLEHSHLNRILNDTEVNFIYC